MCATEYGPDEAVATCAGCPLARGHCGLVRCPKCGYETVAETRLSRLIRHFARLLHSRRAGA